MSTNNKEAALLPCPFCGCEMTVFSNRDWHRLTGSHENDCLFDAEDDIVSIPATGKNLAWLIAAWNLRSALTASEAPATEQAPPLPTPDIRINMFEDILPTDGRLFAQGDFYTADQVLEHREQYAAWKIAALRAEQAPLLAKIEKILAGIDRESSGHESGWWETSGGAEFGAERLHQIRNLFAEQAPELIGFDLASGSDKTAYWSPDAFSQPARSEQAPAAPYPGEAWENAQIDAFNNWIRTARKSINPFSAMAGWMACARAALSTPPAVPPGHVIVPVEPTEEMLRAAQGAWLADPARKSSTLYRAMLSAVATGGQK